jgi:hypothetical protein
MNKNYFTFLLLAAGVILAFLLLKGKGNTLPKTNNQVNANNPYSGNNPYGTAISKITSLIPQTYKEKISSTTILGNSGANWVNLATQGISTVGNIFTGLFRSSSPTVNLASGSHTGSIGEPVDIGSNQEISSPQDFSWNDANPDLSSNYGIGDIALSADIGQNFDFGYNASDWGF